MYLCNRKRLVKGNGSVPFFYFENNKNMGTSTESEKIETFVTDFIKDKKDLFLVDVKIAPGNKVTLLLDGDKGITIDDCTIINKALYKFIEETQVFGSHNFSLEVSSFGVDRPLQLLRQFKKNIGRNLEVVMNDGTKAEGTLIAADENEIKIEQQSGKGNKMTKKMTTILFNQIKHATVLITF
jgi:ribosome maturation factor RimP